MRKVALISILASLLIAAPAFAQKSDCGRNQPCGQVPWQLPYLPPLLSPSPMPTIVTTPLPPVFTGTPEATVTLTATLAPTPTPYVDSINVTSFSQSFGAENTNADFTSWSANNPVGWTVVGESQPTNYVDESAPDGSAGTGAAKMYRGASAALAVRQAITPGLWYEFETVRTAASAMTSFIDPGVNGTLQWYNETNSRRLGRTTHSLVNYWTANNGPGYVVLDRLSWRPITLDPQYATLASGTFDFLFTLPGSPREYEGAHLFYRANGDLNYWDASVYRNFGNTQWRFRLDRVSAGTATNHADVILTTTPNAIRVVTSGDTHTAYTSDNGGASWTQRSTFSNNTHNTNTGVRVVYASGVTPVRLTYPDTFWPATAIPGTTIPSIPLDTSGIADQLATLGALTDGDSMTITDLQGNPINLEEQFAQLATPAGMFFGYARGLSEINLGTITTFLSFALLTVAIIVALTAADFLLPIIATAFGVIRRVASLILDFLPL